MPVAVLNTAHFNPDTPVSGGQPPVIVGVGVAYDASILLPTANPAAVNAAGSGTAYQPVVSGNALPAGMTSQVLNEDWSSGIQSSRWGNAADGATYGSDGNRIQRWLTANAVVSAGTGGGVSCKLISKRENVGGNAFTAGMLSTRTVGVYYPVFGYYEIDARTPHGQGVWPAFWLRHRDGSTMCEVDILEFFHTQIPGKNVWTLHRTNDAGSFQGNVNKANALVESPTLTPGRHKFGVSIRQEGVNVRFRGYLDGVEVWNYLDTSATRWSITNGTSKYAGGAQVFDIALQGSQIGGNWVGHPDDPTGYSRWQDSCLSGGTKPNSCNLSVGGQTIITDAIVGGALFPNTFEIYTVKVWSAL